MDRKFYRNKHTREVKEVVKTENIGNYTIFTLDDGSRWNNEELNKHHFEVDKIAKDVWNLKRNKRTPNEQLNLT